MPGRLLNRIFLALGFAALLAACVPLEEPYPGSGYGLPQGSYLDSCRDAYVSPDNVLRAECRDRSGRFRAAALQLPCRRDIGNDAGALVCGRADAPERVPSGSYLDSCRDAYVDRGILRAECPTRRGQFRDTALQLPCRRDIGNDNGALVCGRVEIPVPSGSYQSSCRNAYVDGNTLRAECRDRNSRLRDAALQLPCRRDIGNDNGALVCGRVETPAAAPSGSYLASCRNASVLNGVLEAECRRNNGRFRGTSLRLPCRSDIVNENGALVCGRASGTAPIVPPFRTGLSSGGVPRGSYLSSCEGAYVDRADVLHADCALPDGRLQPTTLQLPCRIDITNSRGVLSCGIDQQGK